MLRGVKCRLTLICLCILHIWETKKYSFDFLAGGVTSSHFKKNRWTSWRVGDTFWFTRVL